MGVTRLIICSFIGALRTIPKTAETFPPLQPGNEKVALVEGPESFSYGEVDNRINRFATGLLGKETKYDLEEERVAFFLPASLDYVTVLHGVWRAGGVAVPLNVASTPEDLDHYLTSASVSRLIAREEHHTLLRGLCDTLHIELSSVDSLVADEVGLLPEISEQRRAMMLFTSGTTDKPKGVVNTHKNVKAQILAQVNAWEWTPDDVIPLFLPMHHMHGIINILSCALWTGATVHLHAAFDVNTIAEEVSNGTYTVFMAVPTHYAKFINLFETQSKDVVEKLKAGFRAMRLNVSGSAACPVKIFDQWKEFTGQVLLERYGMTETCVCLSNPYNGERRAGAVGQPIHGVEMELFDEQGVPVVGEDMPGEIRVKGDSVFLEYWNNPQATENAFDDGWFCTGDVAILEDGYYRIMGRSSIDIIKSGDVKLSALEIEGILLTNEKVAEVAVIGAEEDIEGDNEVTAFVGLKEGMTLEYDELKDWCADKLSSYKIPTAMKVVDSLPRNAMGKVVKPKLWGVSD